MTTTETAELVEAARQAGKVFAVNYNVRFYPAVLQMRALVQRGDLGEIIHVNGSYMQDWLLKETDYNWRVLASEGGELRAVGDIGTHWLDTVSFILGSPVTELLADLSTFHRTRQRPVGEVQTFSNEAVTHTEDCPVDTEDFASVLLGFDNGARGNLHYGRRDDANAAVLRASAGFIDASGYTDYPAGHAEGFPDGFKMLYRSIYTAIATGTSDGLFADAVAGHEELRLCEAVMQSHRERRWINL
jgi:predicted dehydrogenase